MTEPKNRSGSKKKIFVKVPGGNTKVKYKAKKPSSHHCALCKGKLSGVPHGKRPSEVAKLSKTQKRPERKFAGELCAKCSKTVMEKAAMVKSETLSIDEVSISQRKYVKAAVK
ncbi:MAG: 50S ribosomal protein L34e [Candidatus Diapherotrites archaeon]|nr:50S ribosomal protein L34e [Candidatus Diapherotrites archaeon]